MNPLGKPEETAHFVAALIDGVGTFKTAQFFSIGGGWAFEESCTAGRSAFIRGQAEFRRGLSKVDTRSARPYGAYPLLVKMES